MAESQGSTDLTATQFAAELFRELFEGIEPGSTSTYVVEKKEGIFDAVESLSAVQASKKVLGLGSTIGAHYMHLIYYVSLVNSEIRGEEVKPDWNASWAKQTFSREEWEEMKQVGRSEYGFAKAWYDDLAPKGGEPALSAIANLVHTAYHLGAIRALIHYI